MTDYENAFIGMGFSEMEDEKGEIKIFVKVQNLFPGKSGPGLEINPDASLTAIITVESSYLGQIFTVNLSFDSGICKNIPLFAKKGRDWKEVLFDSQLILENMSCSLRII